MPSQTQIDSKSASSPANAEKPSPRTAVRAKTAKTMSVPASKRAVVNEREQAARKQAPTSVQPVEPEDAYLTGVSRSLQRRLLGLNVEGAHGQAKPHPEAAPGQHATGSFTGTKSVPAQASKSPGKKKD